VIDLFMPKTSVSSTIRED